MDLGAPLIISFIKSAGSNKPQLRDCVQLIVVQIQILEPRVVGEKWASYIVQDFLLLRGLAVLLHNDLEKL